MGNLLVCDDEPGIRETLAILFRRAGHEVSTANGVNEARRLLAERPPFDLVVTDLMMPDGSGMDVLDAARARDPATQVIVITAYASTDQAVDAMKVGAYDFVQKPFRNHELLATVDKAIEKRLIALENRALRAQVGAQFRLGDIVGRSSAMQRVIEIVRRVASARTSVLITGESGTGKELVARALHYESDRAAKPFVVVNCGALPENLMESELFGHEKGSFTGAETRKEGLFRAAHDGTLFLDEVGELSTHLQVKLLRVLQERKVRPVGAEKEIEVDVRVVAATNRLVEKDVSTGRFRQDLFYRLNVIRIELPPLRDRPEDIALLAEHFLTKHMALQSKRLHWTSDALRWVSSQPFEGNVRELENVVERAVTLAEGNAIGLAELPASASGEQPSTNAAEHSGVFRLPESGPFDLDGELGRIERAALLKALERSAGVRTEAARLLGMTFRSFRYRLAKYGLAEEEGGTTPDGKGQLE